MTKRAEKAISETYGSLSDCGPAIAALVDFAAQTSGIETANYFNRQDLLSGNRRAYFDGCKAYRREVRSIVADWKRFKEALAVAACEQVTGSDVIAAAPHAFSGRLEWVSENYLREKHGINTDYTPRWEYTTGQYFPTEYRKAAAVVLEYATQQVRRSRPAHRQTVTTISELKSLNKQNGGCWFDAGSMRFFGTRIESGILRGKYFVTSEQREDHLPRRFTLRSFGETGDINTVGEFHGHTSKADAIASIPQAEQKAA